MSYPTSGQIICSFDGQVIQNLDITNLNGNGIDTNGHSNIIIKNVIVRHWATSGTTAGIFLNGGSNNSIFSADILVQTILIHGPLPFEMDNIYIQNSPNAIVNNVRLTHGSTGIYCINSSNSTFSFIEGHEQWGPFPRGQLVQWSGCTGGSLSDFSNKCDPATAYTEDNINIFNSTGIQIQRGLIDGNNSGTGEGVIFDDLSSGTVDSVDVINWCCGAFSVYNGGGTPPQGHDVRMTNVRCRDSYLPLPAIRGGGTPSSGGLAFAIGPGTGSNVNITGNYHNLANPGPGPGGIKYQGVIDPTDSINVTDVNFSPRTAILAQLQRDSVSDKNFIVKNGLIINTNLLTAFAGQVGICTANPDANLTLTGTANLNGNVAIAGALSVANQNTSFINIAGISSINSTKIALAANVFINTSTFVVGNTILNSALLNMGNSTVNSTVNSTGMVVGAAVQNTSGFFVGGNTQLTTTNLILGNSSINSVINSTAFSLNGQTIVSSPAFLSLNPNSNISWNMALGFNASFQINSAAIFQAPTNYIVGASYSIFITQANGGNKSLTFSTSGVNFDFGVANNPILSTTAGAIDFIFLIPYQANSTFVSIRCVFNKSALT